MKNIKKEKRGISGFDFFCIGFGAIVGVGWAVSINRWIMNSGGPIPAAIGYLIAMVAMIPVGLCYCELCPMLPFSGGSMMYANRSFGKRAAFWVGWITVGAYLTIIPWEAINIVDIIGMIFPAVKGETALYSIAGAEVFPGHILIGTAISVLLFCVNRKGVASTMKFQRILCILLICCGAATALFSLFRLDIQNFSPVYENVNEAVHSNLLGGAVSTLATVPFFLAGFETISQTVESSGGDAKSAGKTVVLSLCFACLFYAGLILAVGGAMPWKEFILLDTPAIPRLLRTIYGKHIGTVLYNLILCGALCGLLSVWNSFFMASSQLLMSMGRSGFLPKAIAAQDEKSKAPKSALRICLVVSLFGPFLGMGLIDPLTSFGSTGFVFSWLMASACVIRLRKAEPDLQRPFLLPGGTKTAGIAVAFMSVLLLMLLIPGQSAFIGNTAAMLLLCWLAIGAVFWFTARKK